MAKGKKRPAPWQGLLAGGLLSLGIYLLGLLLLTLLVVKGVLSEGGSFPAAAVLCTLSTLLGGLLAVRLTGWRAGGLLAAALVLFALGLAGLGFWEEITWLGRRIGGERGKRPFSWIAQNRRVFLIFPLRRRRTLPVKEGREGMEDMGRRMSAVPQMWTALMENRSSVPWDFCPFPRFT